MADAVLLRVDQDESSVADCPGGEVEDDNESGAAAHTGCFEIIEEDDLDGEGATDAMLGVIDFVAQKDAAVADDLASIVLNAPTAQDAREVVFTELADGRTEEGASQTHDAMDVEDEPAKAKGGAKAKDGGKAKGGGKGKSVGKGKKRKSR